MNQSLIFRYKADTPQFSTLNNPFSSHIPEIAKLAASEFQEFLSKETKTWDYDFSKRRGKMFGVLVVESTDGSLGYLGAVSGLLAGSTTSDRLVPPIMDETKEGYWLTTGMTELTELCEEVNSSNMDAERSRLIQKRKQKSKALQQRLFEGYNFLSLSGKQQNLLEIFKRHSTKTPPAAAGDCAAPKLLQYALQHKLKPIALAEFYWGTAAANTKEHKAFYPACKDRCRPILEYMLEDEELFQLATKG
ncbi:MAG: pseudouridylate synthase [Saprospiraceae bacterium]